MVTTRSTHSEKPRVTWTTDGVKVTSNTQVKSVAGPKRVPKKTKIPSNNTAPIITRSKKQKTELAPAVNMVSPRVTRSRAKTVNTTRTNKVTTRATKKTTKRSLPIVTPKTSARKQKNHTVEPAVLRRSTRLTDRSTGTPLNPAAPVQDESPGTVEDATVFNGDALSHDAHAAQVTLPPNDQVTDQPATIDEGTPIIEETPVDEETMAQYMAAIRRRIDAIESRELLLASINAPYWSDELHRDLLKEVVKAWSAISVGRFKDINEVIQLPLEHTYWAEEIRVTQNVSLAA